ncbi:GDSL-type esterase/lipase family protein [Brevundimonas subvibrioides]|uniref:GDSL-type esterase/lipase family protein n=1 Tax=Brevundimonas subvibrioides TaxID=74313 RepID=UPI0022B46436|nr:GDSL-type esterase/lipase family protein [Brevundimonas subvibrioides]
MSNIIGARHPQRVWTMVLSLLAASIGSSAFAQTPEPFASTRPTARIEYWQQRLNEIEARLSDPASLAPIRLVFLGDSITDFWTMAENPWFPGTTGGRAVWTGTFGGADSDYLALNMGISGDRTEHLLQRILPKGEGGLGELDRPDLDPDVIVLLIGINNSWAAEDPAVSSIFEGVRAVVEAVHARKPRAMIVLQSLLPTNETDRNENVVKPVNAALEAFASESPQTAYVRYLDLYPTFLTPDGQQNRAFFMDAVHPDEDGYRAWRDRLVPFLDDLRQ